MLRPVFLVEEREETFEISRMFFEFAVPVEKDASDLKLKLDINNEVGLESLEQQKRRARPNNATQAWPVRNRPPSSW